MEAERKTIDGIVFEVSPLGFKQGRKAFVRLSKAVGPALAAAKSLEDLKGSNVTAMLEKLVREIDDEDLEWFSDVFGKVTRFSREGDKWPFLTDSNRELLFQGRIMLFLKWLAFSLEVQFSDFYSQLKDAS